MGVLLSSCAAPLVEPSGWKGEWISYPAMFGPETLRGRLLLPRDAQGKMPAVVIAHGSGGYDARSEKWAAFFAQHGIASLAIDYFGPRGVNFDSKEQPTPTIDLYAALKVLRDHPAIDAQRIAMIGFSRGGQMVGIAANDGGRLSPVMPRAYIALYPNCGHFEPDPSPTLPPLLIQVGSRDTMADPDVCKHYVSRTISQGRKVELTIYDGAYHAWDGDYAGTIDHRAPGRRYRLEANPLLTQRSMNEALEFLRAPLGLESTGKTAGGR